jgi:hypothetical protein
MQRSLKVFLLCSVLITGVILFDGAASATSIPADLAIDFRTEAWASANGEQEYKVGNVTVRSYDASNSYNWTAQIYQDTVDGLGVLGGEHDEIDGFEFIWVHIDGGMALNGVWITDLFDVPDGAGSGEEGQMLFTELGGGLHYYSFSGKDADPGNGEIWVSFGGEFWVTNAFFGSKPWPGCVDNEFSVAGFTGAPVPEPATMLLLGAGLIGLAGVGRRRFLKKA